MRSKLTFGIGRESHHDLKEHKISCTSPAAVAYVGTACPVNYHESRRVPSRSSCVKRFGLGIECLALSTLAAYCAEAFHTQLFPRGHHRTDPLLAKLLKHLAAGMFLLGHHPAVCGRFVLKPETLSMMSLPRFSELAPSVGFLSPPRLTVLILHEVRLLETRRGLLLTAWHA